MFRVILFAFILGSFPHLKANEELTLPKNEVLEILYRACPEGLYRVCNEKELDSIVSSALDAAVLRAKEMSKL